MWPAVTYRVVVVGAGPGGLVLARELAGQGIGVTVCEKESFDEIGHNWSDAVEYSALKAAGLDMPELVGRQWEGTLVKDGPDEPGIFEKHAVPRLKVYSPGRESFKEIGFDMVTTDRRRLAQHLVKEAEAAGAEIIYNHEGRDLLYTENDQKGPGGVSVLGLTLNDFKKEELIALYADLVVESSGFKSVLRSSLPKHTGLADPFEDSDFALVHREVYNYDPEAAEKGFLSGSEAQIIPDHYRYGYNSGYQWSHIHNERQIDIGAGIKSDHQGADPREIVEAFIAEHPAVKPGPVRGGRSLCIVGRPLKNFVAKGFFVLGDAASTSVPTTGCGVGSAISVALHAAEVIAEAAAEERNDLEKLWEINRKFYLEDRRGPSLAALNELRSVLQTLTHEELDFLFQKDLIDAATLQDAINGSFQRPVLAAMTKALWAGITRPALLMKLNSGIRAAEKTYNHYLNYPSEWNALEFEQWQREL